LAATLGGIGRGKSEPQTLFGNEDDEEKKR
jgi:hypothetical protein